MPDSWGPKRYGDIADVALTRRGPDEIGFAVDSHFLLVFLTPQPRREIRLASSRQIVFDAPAGSAEIIPAGASFEGRWHVPKENILVSLDPARLAELAAREFGVGSVEIRPIQPGRLDPTAARIAALIRDSFASAEPASKLYTDCLTTALMLHFIQTHSSLSAPQGKRFHGGLSPRIVRDIEGFIADNLAADISLASLADRAGLSYSHFLRSFQQSTGMSPHRYIMWQRANRARELAGLSSLPLGQIARQCGFSNQSHMTTVMKSLLNQTPGQVRREAGRSCGVRDED